METALPIMIQAQGISKYFGSFIGIEDVSFSIPRGQIVAFLGPNGAGKSTAMKILTGFMAPTKGRAFIAGSDIHSDRIEASRQLGYLPENGPLYLDMTPSELLTFFGEARGLRGKELNSRIEWISEKHSIEEVLDKPIGKLSKGNRQRVGLAQALIHDPDVIIMDEPTVGLDPNQIKVFRESILRLGVNKTILISTHILQEVDAVADRVLFVNEGKLVFDGTPKDLRQDGSLEEPFYRLTRSIPPDGLTPLTRERSQREIENDSTK